LRLFYSDENSERLDKFLAKTLQTFSREFCKKLIQKRQIFVNSKVAEASLKLHKNDVIDIPDSIEKPLCDLEPEKSNFEIIYEDNHIIVINKSAGILTHPTQNQKKHTLVNFLLDHTTLSSIGLPLRPGIVHRLDKNTSGCLVVAKTDIAYFNLVTQFRERTIKKKYRAVVSGYFPSEIDEISVPLAISNFSKTSVNFARGKEAKTKIQIIQKTKNVTYLEAMPITGRTHQIRVSLAFLGYPVLGDTQYGRKSILINRQALHAHSISFNHPYTKQNLSFTAKPPEDFLTLLKELGIHY